MARNITTQLIIEGKNKAAAAFKEADGQLNKMGLSAKKAGAFIAGALSITALSAFVKTSIDAADAASKSAAAVGLAVEEYTALQYAAELAGVGSAELDAGLSKLNRTIDAAANGGAAQVEAFDRLGISVKDAGGNIKSADQVLSEVAAKFQTLPNGVQKSALAMELFGRSGAKLIPLLNGGAEGLEELRKEAEALGLVISTDMAAQSEVFNDNLTKLGAAATGAGNQIATDMLPSLVQLSELMIDLNKNTEASSIGADVLGGALKVLATVALILGATFTTTGGIIAAVAAAALSAAKGDFREAAEILKDGARDYAKTVGESIERADKLWSGAGEATAKAAVELKKQQQVMEGDLKRSTDEMAKEVKRQVSNSKAALAERIKAEREAGKELEKAKQAQLDTEKRYSEALAGLNSGGDASYGQAQALKVAARGALANGDIEGAKQKAQASLEVLQKLADAGENTYGFEGFIKELQVIEQNADQINVDKAQKSFDEAQQKALELKTILDDLKSVKISVEMDPEEIAQIKSQLEALSSIVITPKVIALGADVPEPQQFATGGQVRGPGSGTSDSIPALLSNGEYVIRAAAVRKLGKGYLDMINNGMPLRRFADGGLAESVSSMSSGPSFPDLGRVAFELGGENVSVYASPGDALNLQRLASKFGRTRR
jgi:hypothetical protein